MGLQREAVGHAIGTETELARIVCDYIAGMTDRFALQSHARLTGAEAAGLEDWR